MDESDFWIARTHTHKPSASHNYLNGMEADTFDHTISLRICWPSECWSFAWNLCRVPETTRLDAPIHSFYQTQSTLALHLLLEADHMPKGVRWCKPQVRQTIRHTYLSPLSTPHTCFEVRGYAWIAIPLSALRHAWIALSVLNLGGMFKFYW